MSAGRWLKRFLLTLFPLILLAAVIGTAGVFWAKGEFTSPGSLATPKTIVFERGAGFMPIADRLEAEGVIRYGWLFKAAAVATESRHKFKAGEYAFAANISQQEVLRKIVAGEVVVHKVTIPEGLRTVEITALLQAEPALTGAVPTDLTEGALLPETYHFLLGDTRESVIRRMQQDMQTTLTQLWEKRDPAVPLATVQEAVTLASIVEKETGLAEERPRVAAVFINRLRLKMKLQSDPTAIYAVERDKGPLGRALTRDDLAYASPYNTYYAEGLPPAPIVNPGKASLAAVMNPLATSELYFVASGNGGHNFAATLEGHNANVAKWREAQKEAKQP